MMHLGRIYCALHHFSLFLTLCFQLNDMYRKRFIDQLLIQTAQRRNNSHEKITTTKMTTTFGPAPPCNQGLKPIHIITYKICGRTSKKINFITQRSHVLYSTDNYETILFRKKLNFGRKIRRSEIVSWQF